VYVVLIGAFFPVAWAGLVLFSLYALGIVTAAIVARALRRTVLRGGGSMLMMELPSYQRPAPKVVWGQVRSACRAFAVLAGTVILFTSVAIWFLSYFPRPAEIHADFEAQRRQVETVDPGERALALARLDVAEQAAYLEQSLLARVGKVVQPLFAPAGFDWRTTIGILAAFPARELIVPTLGILFREGEVDPAAYDLAELGSARERPGGLRQRLRAARRPDGTPAFGGLVALALMVFFALCSQCAATLGTIRRETRSWRWPLFTFTYMTVVAWVAAVLVYQAGSALPAAVALLLLWMLLESRARTLTYVAIVDSERVPVARGVLEFFAFDDSRVAGSPTEKLGELSFEGEGPFAVGPELVPDEALVRVRAEGYGMGYGYLRRGDGVQVCDLGPPARLRGVVRGPDGAGAAATRVQAFGGGPHGVLLVDAVTDAEGRFEIAGFSSTLAYLRLRVFKEFCAVAAQDAWLDADGEVELTLVRTRPVAGRVVTAHDVSVQGLRVQADSVPGVETRTDADGSFELDHLPAPPAKTRLVLGSLPEGYTHQLTLVSPGTGDLVIRVFRSGAVEGRVVEAAGGPGVRGATVVHEHGPRGREVARCDETGYFRIGRSPPGGVALETVVWDRAPDASGVPRSTTRTGLVTLELEEGEVRTGISIAVR
jgi:hypothetical protein